MFRDGVLYNGITQSGVSRFIVANGDGVVQGIAHSGLGPVHVLGAGQHRIAVMVDIGNLRGVAKVNAVGKLPGCAVYLPLAGDGVGNLAAFLVHKTLRNHVEVFFVIIQLVPVSGLVLDGGLKQIAVGPVGFPQIGVGILHPKGPQFLSCDGTVAQAVDKGHGFGPAYLIFRAEGAVRVAHNPPGFCRGIDIVIGPVLRAYVAERGVIRVEKLRKSSSHSRKLGAGNGVIGPEFVTFDATQNICGVAGFQFFIVPGVGRHVGKSLFCHVLLCLGVCAVIQTIENRCGFGTAQAAFAPDGLVRVAHNVGDFFLRIDMVGGLGKAAKLVTVNFRRVLYPVRLADGRCGQFPAGAFIKKTLGHVAGFAGAGLSGKGGGGHGAKDGQKAQKQSQEFLGNFIQIEVLLLIF